jgi:hypothetical protein
VLDLRRLRYAPGAPDPVMRQVVDEVPAIADAEGRLSRG